MSIIEVRNSMPATKLISAGEGNVLLSNLDSSVTLWVGDDNSIVAGDVLVATPIAPTTSVGYDGKADVYGVATSTIQVAKILGGTSFFLPATLSGLGGIKVFIQSATPTEPPTIPVNSIWLKINIFTVVQFSTWNGTTWISQAFDASGIIAVGTVIANLIAAGTIFAGIVDGTTVKAGSFIGGNYFGYDGTPAVNTLSVSVIPGTVNVLDPFGNVALPGHTVYQTPVALNSLAFNMQQGILTWYSWNGAGWGFGASIDWTVPNNFIELIGAPVRSIDGTRANPTLITSDSRTNFGAFGAGFGAGVPAPWQALMPTGVGGVQDVVIGGQVLSTAATAANSTMVTLIKAPVVQQDFVVPTNAAGYTPAAGSLPRVVRVDTAGNVRLLPSTSAANQFVILDGIRVVMG